MTGLYKKILSLVLWLVGVSMSLFSQSYYFDNYSVADGLAQSSIYSIIQDKSNYLWMGTLNGVTKFDGVNFLNYGIQDGLSENGVQTVIQDSRGIIWFGHLGGGISRYLNNQFEHIDPKRSFITSDVTSICEDASGALWFTSAGSGAVKLNNPAEQADKLIFTSYKGKQLSDRVFGSLKTADGTLYFRTDLGIKAYNPKNNSFEAYLPDGLTRYFSITCMFEDAQGDRWFGTYHGGLYRWHKKTGKFTIYDIRDGLSSNWISTLSQDDAGNIWVGTWGGGLTRIGTDRMTVFNTSNGLPDNKIRCLLKDREGNLLIGSNEHGLCIYKGEAFISYTVRDGLIDPQVWAVSQDKLNRLWFGTSNGISVFDPSKPVNNRFTHYTQQTKAISNQIRFIVPDNNGDLWIGSADQGVVQFQIRANRFVFPVIINSTLPSDGVITALTVDKTNNLWVGTNDGLTYYEINKQKITTLTQIHGMAGNEISSLYVSPDNVVYVGSKLKGLTIIKDTSITRFNLGRSVTPTAMCTDDSSNLWIGTEGQGIFIIKQGKVHRTLTENDGLLSNLITSLTYHNGTIFIGTNKGLNQLLPAENKLYAYTDKNGFTGIEIKNNASFTDASGNLWFGTVNGAMRMNPQLINTALPEPSTHITRLRINLKDRPVTDNLTLGYRENSLIIDFSSICLTNPNAVKYQVMLQGADADWQPVTTQTNATYPALPPGRYTFKVKACNSNGVWNNEPLTFHFQIRPPFYQTWWFIFGCIALATVSVIIYIKMRERTLVMEKRMLEKKIQERTAEVTNKNEELAAKNKDITDSIHYAKRIQVAMLPPEIPFADTFILFKPKDIVSGDFYWLHANNQYEIMVAADCTGHGVPGAFMSIIGHNILNKIIKEHHIYDPGQILQRLNDEVITMLCHSSDTMSMYDGMDLALICYQPATRVLQFAGAFNPLYHIRNNQLREIPANRFSIGRNSGNEKVFTTQTLQIEKNDSIYIFSDGYVDQFGGPNEKKIKPSGLKNLLLSIQHLEMNAQKHNIEKHFDNWRGNTEQIDDVLVMGRRFI